jgi:hypothetical protein
MIDLAPFIEELLVITANVCNFNKYDGLNFEGRMSIPQETGQAYHLSLTLSILRMKNSSGSSSRVVPLQ